MEPAGTASKKKNQLALRKYFDSCDHVLEVGIDEAGRGPMLGRVYSAAVILPKDGDFKHELMKDSKRFSSHKKINEVASYIKENAVSWSVAYSTEQVIDEINIRNATHRAMHEAVTKIINPDNNYHLLVDGNDFKSYITMRNNMPTQIRHTCIEGGDNKYTSIAAASILAKVSRDEYIEKLCDSHPDLDDKYCILKNKGYGTKAHHDGIYEHGITEFHRKTFGICRNYNKIENA